MSRCDKEEFICNPRCDENNFTNNPVTIDKCSRCGNLLKNPSFETGSSGWITNNVIVRGTRAFEGIAVAQMGAGFSSISQDVLLDETCKKPLLLSFEIYPSVPQFNVHVGDLIVEVLWLNDEGEIIGTGLRTLIPEARTSDSSNYLTFIDITDTPPSDAVIARLQFIKGAIFDDTTNMLDIDNVILSPIDSVNLVKNSGFQSALTNWNAANASPEFTLIYEGTGAVSLDPNGILFQNVPISNFPWNPRYLFSFAAVADLSTGLLRAEVIWLSRSGEAIGTGIGVIINASMLDSQDNYTTYVDVTTPAPQNAVTAQIKFTNTDGANVFQIDKVIFARTMSTNLLENSSFENDLTLSPWIGEGTNVILSPKSYEGNRFARIGANGGFVSQEVPVEPTRCYLFDFAYDVDALGNPGNLLAEVYWLNSDGQEIGLALNIIIREFNGLLIGKWVTFLGVTEPAPSNAVRARIRFSKPAALAPIDIDKVVFARLT